MSRQVAGAATHYFTESVERGDICWDEWIGRADRDRRDVAEFIGAAPEAVAFLQNASLGLNIVARSFESSKRVLAVRPEFPSCTTPFLRAGHLLSFIETPISGYVDSDMVNQAIDEHKSDLFVLSAVQYANGFRADLKAIGKVCRERNVIFVVDATQSIGAYGIDMVRDGIGVLVFSGYKWATAGYGNAVLATGSGWKEKLPPLVGWRSAKQAYDLENDRLDLLPTGVGHEMGHPPFPGIFAMGEAIRLFSEPTKVEIEQNILRLTSELRNGLDSFGLNVRSVADPAHRSGITLVELTGAQRIKEELQKRNVWVTARQGGLRISVHTYNNSADIQWLLDELKVLA